MSDDLLAAHKRLISRYRLMIRGLEFHDQKELLDFCDLAKTLENPDKLSRWVGYLQGILIERNVVTVESERNYSREIYKPIYESMGYAT